MGGYIADIHTVMCGHSIKPPATFPQSKLKETVVYMYIQVTTMYRGYHTVTLVYTGTATNRLQCTTITASMQHTQSIPILQPASYPESHTKVSLRGMKREV